MKNFKKALSIFMALCMMLVSVRCIGAFATADSLAKLEEDVTAFDGKLSVAEPDADTLAAYEKLVEAFKALTADEKDKMDIIAFDKLYHLALGTYTVRSSVARGTAYRAGLDSNKAAALIVTWNYLYGELVSAGNVASIKGFIDGLEVAGIVKSLAKGLVSVVAKVKSGTAFRFVAFVNILLKVVVVIKNVVAKVIGIIKK